MTLKDTALILLIILIALAWGARDWIAYEWHESKADTQIKLAVGGITATMCLLIYLLKPIFVQLFF